MEKSIEQKIVHGTIVIISVSILSKFASFIAEAILASLLGTTANGDAYYMVSSIQQVIYPMLSVGIWRVFLPIYKEKITKNQCEEANQLSNRVITLFFVVSIIATLLIAVFAPSLVHIVAPGFDEATSSLCAELVRISSPMYVFIIISAIYACMLQCHDKFFASQIREVASHIPTIIIALFFYKRFGVYGLAVGLALGGASRLFIELPFVDWNYYYNVNIDFNHKDIRMLLHRLPSAALSEGIHLINTLVDKMLASTLNSGAISALSYGSKLTSMFNGLLSSAVSTALYPQMVECIANNDENKLRFLLIKIINIYLIIMVPITCACILFAQDVVCVVFQRGAFNSASTDLTSGVFSFYILGLVAVACNSILTNVFYSYGDTKTPLRASSISVSLNIILNLLFIKRLGVAGLALATTIAAYMTMLINFIFVNKRIELNLCNTNLLLFKVIIISLISCGLPNIIFTRLFSNSYLRLLLSAITGTCVYYLLLKILKVKEIDDVSNLLINKVKRKNNRIN